MRLSRSWLMGGVGVPVLLSGALAVAPPKPQTIVIESTLEAALAQPRVHVRLSDGKRILTGEPALPLLDDERQRSFIAFLDTGASGYVISKSTAERFGVQAHKDAVYNEVGLHGATQVGVSMPYAIALAGASGEADEQPPAKFGEPIQKEAALQLNRSVPDGLMALTGPIDVIGMPAISKLVIEVDPAPMRRKPRQDDELDLGIIAAGPAVRLHDRKTKPKDADVVIALEYKDFNQRAHPDNRGALPELASNPLIPAVTCEHGAATFTGDWLLDTGAAASIISTKQAQTLGLYNEDGTPARAADFTLPLGGIGGDVKSANGYIIDRIKIKAHSNITLEYRSVRVVVQDVGMTLSDGRRVILDGVFGMNLLLPSGSGFGKGLPDKTNAGSFDRIWIDGPRGTLSLKRASLPDRR